MGTKIATNFDLAAQIPLDTRMVVADLTARDAIAAIKRFDGLFTYVVSEAVTYQLQGGITNGDWEVYGSGSGGKESFVITDATANRDITAASIMNSTFQVLGDITNQLYAGKVFTVTGSSANDGTYMTIDAVFDGTVTEIVVASVLDETADGSINFGSVQTLTIASIDLNTGFVCKLLNTDTGYIEDSTATVQRSGSNIILDFLFPSPSQYWFTITG
jgi:hypothetical protein